MIIWGWRSYLKTLGMVTFVCSNCHNPAAQRVIERMTKFCLFFIPLFPISRKYVVSCTYCGISSRIDKAAAENYVAAGANQPAPGLPPQHPDFAAPGQPQPNQHPQAYGQNPQPYGQNPQQYGQNPQQYGQNPQQYGVDPQQYGVDPQQYGVDPQHPGQGR